MFEKGPLLLEKWVPFGSPFQENRVPINFGHTVSCPLCLSKEDSQEHLLSCKKLNENLVINQKEFFCYNDIFSTSVEKNQIAIRALEKLMKKRKLLLDVEQEASPSANVV